MQSYISFTSGIYYNNVEVDGIYFTILLKIIEDFIISYSIFQSYSNQINRTQHYIFKKQTKLWFSRCIIEHPLSIRTLGSTLFVCRSNSFVPEIFTISRITFWKLWLANILQVWKNAWIVDTVVNFFLQTQFFISHKCHYDAYNMSSLVKNLNVYSIKLCLIIGLK